MSNPTIGILLKSVHINKYKFCCYIKTEILSSRSHAELYETRLEELLTHKNNVYYSNQSPQRFKFV